MPKRRNHDAAYKARVALEALKGGCTLSELATVHEVHPTMIHQWKKARLEGAAGILERGGKAAATAEIAEDTVRDLACQDRRTGGCQHFFGRKAQTLDREVRRGMIERTHPKLSVGAQCQLLSMSRSSSHYVPQGETALTLDRMLLIATQFLKTPFYGVRQMTWHLQNEGHAVNEKHIRRLMRLMRLMPIYQKPNTSKPAKGHKSYPYLLGGLRIDRTNRSGALTSPTDAD